MTQLTSTVLATANSVITVKTHGVMAGSASAFTSVNGPGLSTIRAKARRKRPRRPPPHISARR